MMKSFRSCVAGVAAVAVCAAGASAQTSPVSISIDAGSNQRPINPLIYGVAYATTDQLRDLNAPLNRSGGDDTSLYNWRLNSRNGGNDWYFESMPETSSIFDQHADNFVALTQAAGSKPMITIPTIGWVSKLASNGGRLASFSIAKYGQQTARDNTGMPNAGNGILASGGARVINDPNDANQFDSPTNEQAWVSHLVNQWGRATSGGVQYYIMDNEPSYWHTEHRDVHPIGAHAQEIATKVATYSAMVKSVDPSALIVAPEEPNAYNTAPAGTGWNGYFYSGYDQQNGTGSSSDFAAETSKMPYLSWLLSQWKLAGHPVDVVSVHFYPSNGEYSGDVSARMQLTRNITTRDLWDKNYSDPSTNTVIALIPQLRNWVDTYYYPGTPIAITEYSWGQPTVEATMNGATTQADIFGIFGQQGLDMATRWATPATGTPTYLAMKLFGNYDGNHSRFGNTSISVKVPDPNTLSAFAALQNSGAMTVMVINKQLAGSAAVQISLANFAATGSVSAYQLADNNPPQPPVITRLPDSSYAGQALNMTVPAQSVTLLVLSGPS